MSQSLKLKEVCEFKKGKKVGVVEEKDFIKVLMGEVERL